VPLHPLYGHQELQERLATSLAAGTLPTALLLVGPPGVGKQRLGLWLAQAIVCEQDPGAPCGSCHHCRLALQLGHPDIHWFFPIPRPKADETKQVEEAEESLTTAIAERRESGVYQRPDGMAALFLPLVRVLHRRAQMRPAMARAKVFLVAEAERLVPQASSQEAANAMLKVLEEPPPDTYFVLTAAEPSALLPTIRSRLVQLRVGRLKPPAITAFLTEVARLPERDARRRAELAAGSIGAALAMTGGGEDDRGTAQRLLRAAASPLARHTYALGVKPFGGRGDFTGTLDAAADLLRDELARRLQGSEPGDADPPTTRLLAQVQELERARRLAQGNVNPQLIVADLLRRLAEAGR
jgi:DNA polymerase-3 subunit delta'